MRTGTYVLLSLCPPILANVQKTFDGCIQEGENSVFTLGAIDTSGSKFPPVSIAKPVCAHPFLLMPFVVVLFLPGCKFHGHRASPQARNRPGS